MSLAGLGSAVLAPLSAVLSRLLVQVFNTAMAARDVLIEQSNFNELSRYLHRIAPVLQELQEKNVTDNSAIRLALESLEREIKTADELIVECTNKSRLFLLYNCTDIVKRLQAVTQEIGRCLGLLDVASLSIALHTRTATADLCRLMQTAEFKAAAAGEEIIAKIDMGMRDGRADRDCARELLFQIAQVVGVPDNAASWKKEFEKLKKEKDEALLRKSQAEAIQLEQILSFLSQAETPQPEPERQKLGTKPLQAFNCPITGEVMEDPVEIASGFTVERKAIEEWFEAGHRTCPITGTELHSFEVQPNVALRHCIKDWRDQTIRYHITSAKSKLQLGSDEDKISSLKELQKFSEGGPARKVWIQEEGLIPIICTLVSNTNKHQHIRQTALSTLCSLATDSATIKEEIANVGAIENVVRLLARDIEEGRHAVALLLELSNEPSFCERIGKVQGCILLLVTMLNTGNYGAAEDARQLLEKLANNNQNVVQMAEANYFKPLVHLLLEGPEMTKILMATALAKMTLTDQSKAAIAREGAIPPLTKMISAGKLEAKSAALGVLQSLSTHPGNCDLMIDAGVIPLLLQLLFSVTSVFVNLKELASETLANLATASSMEAKVLDSNDTVSQLLSLLNLVGPVNQGHLLRALNGMASPARATSMRAKLRDGGAIQLLLPFCEVNDGEVRASALKLLYSLSQDWVDEDIAKYFGSTYIQSLVKLLSSSRIDETVAAAGIISNLPDNDSHITEMLQNVEALSALVEMLKTGGSKTCRQTYRHQLLENASRALRKFTMPTDERLQRLAAEQDVIPLLVQVLTVGSPLAKKEAAVVLSQLSDNSKKLSTPLNKKSGLFACFWPTIQEGCIVHKGQCSAKSSFCLLEAGAVAPLVQCLEKESEAHEAVLMALTTLLKHDTFEEGCRVIADAQGLGPIIRVLFIGTPNAKNKAVWMLEKFFRNEKYRTDFGHQAQMHLIDLAQNGDDSDTRSLAAMCLAHMNILHKQSAYFH